MNVTRRGLLAVSALLAACGSRRQDMLPEKVGQPWRRTSLKNVAWSVAEAPLSEKVVRRIQSATYEGPGKLEVKAYETTSAAVAFEAVQRWQRAEDKLLFNRDEHFIVVRFEKTEPKLLNNFARDLTSYLRPGQAAQTAPPSTP